MRHVLGRVPRRARCSDAFQLLQSHLCQERAFLAHNFWRGLGLVGGYDGVPLCAGTGVPEPSVRQAALPGPGAHPPIFPPGTETPAPPGRSSLLTVVFSSWSQSPESLCRFHGNSLAGGNRFWG